MATKHITHYWCDRCLLVDQYIEAPTIPVLVPDLGVRLIELCETDQKELSYLEVVDIAKHYGREPQEVTASDARPKCLECGRRLKNRTSLGTHVRTQHDLTLAEYDQRHGLQ